MMGKLYEDTNCNHFLVLTIILEEYVCGGKYPIKNETCDIPNSPSCKFLLVFKISHENNYQIYITYTTSTGQHLRYTSAFVKTTNSMLFHSANVLTLNRSYRLATVFHFLHICSS
jgi:hypothetical protein